MMYPPRSANKILTVLALALLAGGIFIFYRERQQEPQPIEPTDVTYQSPQTKPTNRNTNSPTSIPASLLIKIPFTPQAPTANWDELHNEACEEASAIMAQAYFNNITTLSPEYVESEIAKLTKWQDERYGYHLSIDTLETLKMVESVYGLKTEIYDISEQRIKQALAENKLVIWPGNGQMLDNPYFQQPGPIYHMIVITGYNDKGFITHDPGTRRGKDYVYSYDTLYEAAGNYNHSRHEVDLTDKKIIVVSK